MTTPLPFFVTCEPGTEGALRRELVELAIHAPKGDKSGVSFLGPFSDAMKVCLHARTAMRVLLELSAFEAPDADALYAGARAIAWGDHLTATSTFAVRATVRDTPSITHSKFAALKLKDAIADALRDRFGARPDVDTEDPDVHVQLHLVAGRARVYLDLAGEPLHRRGWRPDGGGEAPLKETLAAAVLALGGVPVDAPFLDPMCGSGTLAIEHALRARNVAPGLARRFGFERWPDARARSDWPALQEAARAAALAEAPAPILARDASPEAIAIAKATADRAGVSRDVRFELGDVRRSTPPFDAGTLVSNPPYGERLFAGAQGGRAPHPGPPPRGDKARVRGRDSSAASDLDRLYRDLGRVLAGFWGWRVVLLAGNPALPRAIGAPPVISHRLFNGGLECRLLVWQLGN